jgi:hypothetical protein
MSAETSYCECGEWSGVRCEASHKRGVRRVRIRYVPRHLRGTSDAAGHRVGLWSTILVHPSCAAHMREHDPEWVSSASRRHVRRERTEMEVTSAVDSLRAVGR